ncbi:MAG: LamG domain-containing protein, partial [Lentisphaerae bacterium]|nr:LamG domain-containing protein [Lentisphaerota bacterium]
VIASAHAGTIIDNPIAYWDFEGDNLLQNRANSNPLFAAQVHRGAPTAGTLPDTTARAGDKSLVLNGSSAIQLPYSQETMGESFTISIWYYQSANNTRMCVYQTPDNYNITYETVAADASSFATYLGQVKVGEIVTSLDTWNHMVHSFRTADNLTEVKVYVNGTLRHTYSVDSDLVFNTYRINALRIGANRSSDRFFQGMIDEIALWDTNLSAANVAVLYQRGLDNLPLNVSEDLSAFDLENKIREIDIVASKPVPAAIHLSGWGIDNFHKPDISTLQIMENIVKNVNDTANHPDGPFHGTYTNFGRTSIPLVSNGIGQIGLGDFTMEVRFRTSAPSAQRGVLIGNYKTGNFQSMNLEIFTGNILRLYMNPTNKGGTTVDFKASAPANNPVRNGEWHHLAATRNGSTISLWFDGELLDTTQDTTPGSYELSGPTLYLKGDTRTDTVLFPGDIEDARLWVRCLTAIEIADLAGGQEVTNRADLLAEYIDVNGPIDISTHLSHYRTPLYSPLSRITQGDFTLEAFIWTTAPGRGVIMGNLIETSANCVNLELTSDGKLRLVLKKGTETSILEADDTGIRNAKWHHLVGMRRGSQLLIYVDGVQVAETADILGNFVLDTEYFAFFSDNSTDNPEFNGDIRQARIWARSFSDSEIEALNNNAVPGEGIIPTDYLITYYIFNTPLSFGIDSDFLFRTSALGENILSMAFENLPIHNTIALGTFLVQLESVDPVRDGDYFLIRIDGLNILKAGIGFGNAGHVNEPIVAFLELFGEPADPQILSDAIIATGNFYQDPTSQT